MSTGMETRSQVNQGQWKEVPVHDLSCFEVDFFNSILKFHGNCYIKEHLLMSLNNNDILKKWHREVTIKCLDQIIPFWNSLGFEMPFTYNLEQREHDLKNKLKGLEGTLSDGEALFDIKASAFTLMHMYTNAFAHATNPQCKELILKASEILRTHFDHVKMAAIKAGDLVPHIMAKTVNTMSTGIKGRGK